jgi:chromosome segregation protein
VLLGSCVRPEKDFESLEGQLRQLKLEKDRWTREHELLHQKREALDEKLTRAREQASAEAGLPEELDKITEDLRRQALQRKDVLASHEADLSNDRVALAQAKEKWTHAQERFDEKHAEQEDIQSQISWNEAQIEKIDTQWDDGIARKAQLEKDLREGSEERSVCEREVVDSRQEFSRVQEELRAREKELDEIRKTVSGSKDTLMEATLHWERAENEWQMLQSHMLERYHIELDSVDEIEAWEFLKQNYSDLMQYDDEAADAYQERIGAELAELRQKLLSMGEVSVTAIEEYDQIKQEYEFLKQQREDVIKALAQLETTMKEMDEESEKLFNQMFHAINEKFQEYFPLLFGGGTARLELTDAQNMLETGVDIVAQPPGKKLQNIGLLSGGEKALTAVSLIFSIFAVKPSPFCLLDEVDAPLDDANVGRFNTMIRRMCHTSQFILITHNKRTMEMADLLYGITMEEAGVSKLASIRLS